jgi:hypothetical protein
MLWTMSAALIVLWLVMLSTVSAGAATTAPTSSTLTETQKIEQLIEIIRTLKDAKFIRNGKEYDCTAAAQHMRMKWGYAKDKIKTARQFVKYIASSSSQSGRPYRIRFNDGSEVNSGEFLNKELDRLEGEETAAATRPS